MRAAKEDVMAQKHPHRAREKAAQNRRTKTQELKKAKKVARVAQRAKKDAEK
jgi:hypothetical protein